MRVPVRVCFCVCLCCGCVYIVYMQYTYIYSTYALQPSLSSGLIAVFQINRGCQRPKALYTAHGDGMPHRPMWVAPAVSAVAPRPATLADVRAPAVLASAPLVVMFALVLAGCASCDAPLHRTLHSCGQRPGRRSSTGEQAAMARRYQRAQQTLAHTLHSSGRPSA